MTGRTRLRRWSTGGAALLMAAALGGCGSDDDGGTGDDAAAGTSASESDSGGGDVDAFCSAAVRAEALSSQGPAVDPATASPDEVEAAMTEFAEQLEPVLAEAEETAPEEVGDDVGRLTGQLRQALETGDQSVLEGAEYAAADDAVDEFMIGNCGFEQLQAIGVDFAYEGIPETVPAGTVAVTFDNQGEELHEIALVRIDDGVTQSLEELLALPEEEAMSMVSFVGAAFAAPGEADTTFLEMEPGRYAAVCFIPEGTTHEDMPGTGAPHFVLGMSSEFTAA